MNSKVTLDATTTTPAGFTVDSLDSTPALFLHCALFLPGKRIVSDETFRLQTFQGKEGVSTLFEYELELHGNSGESTSNNFTFDDILGCAITVGIRYPVAENTVTTSFKEVVNGAQSGPELALFNGIVASFSVKNRGTYQITMKPALHRLTLTNHYQVYAQKTISDVIKTLLDAQQIVYAPFVFALTNLAVIRTQDWLQTGESDFSFLQRLLSKAHLYFYFKHTATSHTLVFSNQASYDSIFSPDQSLRYDFSGEDAVGLTQGDIISEYRYNKTLSSTGVLGVLTQQGVAWEENSIVPYVSYQAEASSTLGTLPYNLYKSYQYGGSKHEVQDFVNATQSTIDSASCVLSGSSYCAHFRVAHTFTLVSGGASEETNPVQSNLEREPFVLTMVSHNANADGSYQNQFQASSSKDLITPFSMQETQQGSLLAIVVAHASGSVQDPTNFGAPSSFDPEQNQFLDTLNTSSDFQQKGVFVTFSTDSVDAVPVWIKLSASMQTVPTIGAIVQVGKAQDESELPEIQNIIQSNGSMQVIPGGWLANTHVGSSFSTNYGNSKSINYGAKSNADLQQSTGIVNTAYDSGRYDSVGFTQGTNYSFSCADTLAPIASSNTLELYGLTPVAPDLLSASESFGSTYSRQQGAMTSNFSVIGASYSNNTTLASVNISNVGSANNISTVGNTINLNVSGDTVTTSTSGNTVETIFAGNTIRTSTTGDLTETIITGNVTSTDARGNVTKTETNGNVTRTETNGNVTRTLANGDVTKTEVNGNVTKTSANGDVTLTEANGDVTETKAALIVTKTVANAETTNTETSGDTNNISTSGATTNINTTGENTAVETNGPGAKVSTNDAQPHVDNIVTRVTMVEGLVSFL